MFVLWRIRYIDRSSREYHDRDLYLNTKTLDATTRIAIEYAVQSRGQQQPRILKFRHLFQEGDWAALSIDSADGIPQSVFLPEYFEDETGRPVSEQERGQIVTGNPNVVAIPPGAKQHDIDLILSSPMPIPLGSHLLKDEDIRTLGYFGRDLRELEASALIKDGPGTIRSIGAPPSPQTADMTLETGITDDEIRSAAIIFRRLLMKGEPANFNKAVDAYTSALGDHPYSKWVNGVRNEFNASLDVPPNLLPFSSATPISFTTKHLIAVFLYTQYAHQPDARREKQFVECLKQVNGQRAFLMWLFLTELWAASLKIISAGRTIASWFNRYCATHGITPGILASIREDQKGIGAIEKKEVKERRLLEAKATELAMEMWEQNGRPEEGFEKFLDAAHKRLSNF